MHYIRIDAKKSNREVTEHDESTNSERTPQPAESATSNHKAHAGLDMSRYQQELDSGYLKRKNVLQLINEPPTAAPQI